MQKAHDVIVDTDGRQKQNKAYHLRIEVAVCSECRCWFSVRPLPVCKQTENVHEKLNRR